MPGPAKVPLLDPELELLLDVEPLLELLLDVEPLLELLLDVEPLLELLLEVDPLLELLELTGVHVGSIPAGISMPLSIAM